MHKYILGIRDNDNEGFYIFNLSSDIEITVEKEKFVEDYAIVKRGDNVEIFKIMAIAESNIEDLGGGSVLSVISSEDFGKKKKGRLNVEKYADWICHELALPYGCSRSGECADCELYGICGNESKLKDFLFSQQGE